MRTKLSKQERIVFKRLRKSTRRARGTEKKDRRAIKRAVMRQERRVKRMRRRRFRR